MTLFIILILLIFIALVIIGSRNLKKKENQNKTSFEASSSHNETPYEQPAINKQAEDEYEKFNEMKKTLQLPMRASIN